MPFSVQLGLIFALLTALGSIVGFFLKHKGAVQAPPVQWRHPLRSSIALFRSPIYTIGCVVATTSWGFHVLALGLAPISVVQATIAGGLVLITVVADRVFGHSVTRREWIGVALTAAGLAFLAATLEGTTDSAHHDYEAVIFYFTVGLATLAGIVLASRSSSGPALAVSAGLFWAGSDITIKALTGKTDLGVLGVVVAPVRARDRRPQPRRPARLGPLAPARPGRPGDRPHERDREHRHDRRRPDRLPGAAARRPARAGRPARRLRAGDHGGGDDAAADRRRGRLRASERRPTDRPAFEQVGR